MLSVVGKLYGRVLIERVRAGTECAIGEEQCGFWQGRECTDQVFAIRQVCEKYLANGKGVKKVLSCPFWSTVLWCGARLPIHTLNYWTV